MANLNTIGKERAETLKRIVLKYLHGEAIDVVQVRLQIECAGLNKSAKSIYRAISATRQDDPYVEAILRSLGITRGTNESEQAEYQALLKQSKSLYGLLVSLSHRGNIHASDLVNLIEKTKPKTNWTLWLFLGSGASAVFGGIIYYQREYFHALIEWFKRTLPFVINWLSKTATILKSLPVLGIGYNALNLAVNWYLTLSSGTLSLTQKMSALFFKSLTLGLKISAYGLTYLAGGMMSYPAATLSVLSASIDLFKSSFELGTSIYALTQLKLKSPDEEDDNEWSRIADYHRQKNLHQRTMHAAWVSLAAAVLTTLAVAIWCFSPPNLAVAICCVAFITFVSLTRNSIVSHINEQHAHSLQKTIRDIDAECSIDVCPNRYSEKIETLKQQSNKLEKELKEEKKKRRGVTIDWRTSSPQLQRGTLTSQSMFKPSSPSKANLSKQSDNPLEQTRIRSNSMP